MQAIRFALSLLAIAALSACGDATPPSGTGASQTGSAASAAPSPWDTLAALPPEARPYGLDVYTAKCASCHGDLGQGMGKNPQITGLKHAAMQQKLLDLRAGKTQGAHAAAKLDLSDAEIAAVSIYAGE
jgi:mono/diheme cytochrome c family protein